MQFSLISLIPGLIRNLQDCADPELNSYEKNLTMPTHLRTSNRASLQAYMGLPLQLFGKVRLPSHKRQPNTLPWPPTDHDTIGEPIWPVYASATT